MDGTSEKSRKSGSQQAVIQIGEVGFYPFNSLSLSALYHGQAHCIIGSPSDPRTEKLRQQTDYNFSGKTLSLQGKLFNGFSDAFYRGKLPELIIITANMLDVPECLEEYLDFLEKLCSLGFLSQQDDDAFSTLDKYTPQLIFATYGIVFEVIQKKLTQTIQALPNLSNKNQDRLLQKISRALVQVPEEGYDTKLQDLTLFPKPITFNLAGSKTFYMVRATQIFESQQIPYQLNANGKSSIIEAELNLAYQHLNHRIFPLLKRQQVQMDLKPAELSTLFEALGQKYNLLPGLITLENTEKPDFELASLQLSMQDLVIVHQIKAYATNVQLTNLIEYLDTLIETLQPLVPKSSPVAIK